MANPLVVRLVEAANAVPLNVFHIGAASRAVHWCRIPTVLISAPSQSFRPIKIRLLIMSKYRSATADDFEIFQAIDAPQGDLVRHS
jgi:hypothetical protein